MRHLTAAVEPFLHENQKRQQARNVWPRRGMNQRSGDNEVGSSGTEGGEHL